VYKKRPRRSETPLKHFLLDLFVKVWYDLHMASLTAKQIHGHTYYYARFCQRVDGKPKIVRQVYLGKIEDLIAAAEQSHQSPPLLETEVAAFGDVAALFAIAQKLDLVPLLDSILLPKRRPVSRPRSSNRTCPFRASGFPTGFIADSRTRGSGPLES